VPKALWAFLQAADELMKDKKDYDLNRAQYDLKRWLG
jgi:hypothetical protein